MVGYNYEVTVLFLEAGRSRGSGMGRMNESRQAGAEKKREAKRSTKRLFFEKTKLGSC